MPGEQVTLYGAGAATLTFNASDPAADEGTQRWEVWGQVAAFAAAEQAKYASSGEAEGDSKAGQED